VTAAIAAEQRVARARRAPVAVVVAICSAWALGLAAQATGHGRILHQHGDVAHGPPLWAAALLFVVAWQAMLVAMMLPSSLPLVRLFAAAARRQEHAGRVLAAFFAGYAAVWSVFGLVGFFGDVAVHRLVDESQWLAPRPWLISGGALLVAGAFQFSGLKDRCLQQCRQPGPFLMANYRRGLRGGFRVGRRHGLFCLGCCWALMLVMFGLGLAVLWWMAALTLLMVYEKTGRRGAAVVRPAGVVLLAAAMLQLAHPAWLPEALGGSKAFASTVSLGRGPGGRVVRAGAYELGFELGPNRAFVGNRLSLTLVRAGRPVHGARVSATLTMLDMDMPSVTARLDDGGRGRYDASLSPLGMAGRWGMTVRVAPPHAAPFSVRVVDEVLP
jgi:predicted metal-binding membrane protein